MRVISYCSRMFLPLSERRLMIQIGMSFSILRRKPNVGHTIELLSNYALNSARFHGCYYAVLKSNLDIYFYHLQNFPIRVDAHYSHIHQYYWRSLRPRFQNLFMNFSSLPRWLKSPDSCIQPQF